MADEMNQAYELCKLQAQVDGAFPEELLQFWFKAAWDLCADMVGLVPAQRIEREPICIDECGNFTLNFQPSSPVQIFEGYTLVATLPPNLQRSRCTPALCCLCHPYASYTVGQDFCELPPRFVQAVARVFAYIVENRGDTEKDEFVLRKSGAFAFLAPDLTYVM
jgi:hypothetical protein